MPRDHMTEEDLEFLAGGGAAGAAARALDWRESPLGPPRLWSPALRQAARMALGSPMPLLFYWGPRNACLFNDGSAAMMGPERAGSAMGRPGAEVWGAAWEAIEPDVASILAGGPALTHVDRLVPIERGGRVEQTHWTYSHIPVRDESAPLCVGGVMVVATETTQKVLADARVERELARQRALFEQMPGFVGVVEGPAHSYAYVNAAYREISGPRDFIGRSAREVFPELAGQGFFELLDAVFASGERHVARGVPVTLSGEPRQKFIDFLYEPIRGEDGAIRGVFIGGYDATDAARAHQDLRAAQTQLLAANADLARESSERADAVRRVWEASPDLLSVLDGEGRFERANPAWGALLGWEPAELEGASLRELAHPLDAPTIDAAFSALRSGQPAASFEARLRREAGGHLWTSWAAAPDGKSIHCAARDVDADRRARSDRDLIWRHTREAIVAIDERGLMVAVNPACREALGYELSEMLGRHVLDFVHPDDHPPTTPLGGMPPERYAKPRIFENRWLRKEGGLRHMSWIASIAEDGRVYASGRDTTEERDRARALASAEERLRQAQKMEAVGQLTGGLAHDFNNLLMAISGNLQVMQVRRIAGALGRRPLSRWSPPRRAVKRAAALTHRLLAFSRRQTLDPQPVDAAALVAGMDDLIRRIGGPVHIGLEVVRAGPVGASRPTPTSSRTPCSTCASTRATRMPDGARSASLLANRALDERPRPPSSTSRRASYVLAVVGDDGTGMRARGRSPRPSSRSSRPSPWGWARAWACP